MKIFKKLSLTICILLLPLAAFAEDNVEELRTIEITATRTSIEEENPASALTIITQEEIQQKQHMQVKDILREQLGLNIVTPGRLGAGSSVFMRGANSASTLVLIDGVQVKSNTTGSFDLQHLQMDNIERIEILRGPQSTLWGADAVGGVINIVTKRGKGKPTHSLTFEGGSFATFKATLSSSGAFNSADYSFTASRTDSDGFSAFNKDRGATEKDRYANTTYSTKAGYNFWDDARVELIARLTHAKNHFDGFDSDISENLSTSDTFHFAIPLQKSFFKWWDAKINLNFNYDKLKTKDTSPFVGNSLITSRTYTVDFQNNVSINKNVSTIFGFEYQITNGENTSAASLFSPASFFEFENKSQGYYLQTNATFFDSLYLTAGFRQDFNTRFDNKLTYKFEGAYKIKTEPVNIKIRGAYSTGFRAPSINELIFPNFGNINIRPEESENREVGIEFGLLSGRISFGANYFNVDYTDLIEAILIDPINFIFQAQNVGHASSEGVESFFKWRIVDDLDATVSHTWNNAVNEITGATLSRRPKNIFSVSLHHNWNKKLDSTVTVNYRSALDQATNRVGGRAIVRVALSYQINKSIKLTARGENLLDKNYEEPFRFGTQGVSGYAGFVYSFN
ncbi:MAG: TonB-dependent receptor [Nitrospinae bacterium]|nr:TonB-dependent receptor [Nitrospinota bacterium]